MKLWKVHFDDGLGFSVLNVKLRSSDLRAFQMSCTEIKTDTLAAIWER